MLPQIHGDTELKNTFWIALNDIKKEGTFTWELTGGKVLFLNGGVR